MSYRRLNTPTERFKKNEPLQLAGDSGSLGDIFVDCYPSSPASLRAYLFTIDNNCLRTLLVLHEHSTALIDGTQHKFQLQIRQLRLDKFQ